MLILVCSAIIAAANVYRVVRKGGGNPIGWTIGTLILWPPTCLVVGIRYRARAMAVIGGVATAILMVVVVANVVGAIFG